MKDGKVVKTCGAETFDWKCDNIQRKSRQMQNTFSQIYT